MHPTYDPAAARSAGRSPSSATTSEMPIRPPGVSTRNISASTAALSADKLITQLEITTSTEASGSGTASIWPLTNSTLAAPALAAFCRARASMSSVMSTPQANPDGPTRRADSSTSIPPPDPRSSTRSPSRRSATAGGFPQPRLASTAACGSLSVSPSAYRAPPKHSPVSSAAAARARRRPAARPPRARLQDRAGRLGVPGPHLLPQHLCGLIAHDGTSLT